MNLIGVIFSMIVRKMKYILIFRVNLRKIYINMILVVTVVLMIAKYSNMKKKNKRMVK